MMIGLDVLLEGVVELDLAGRDGRLAQLGAAGAEMEALAVHVIAIGDRVVDHDGMRAVHVGGKPEGLLGRQEVLVGPGRRCAQRAAQGGQEQDESRNIR
jgi:hypothetical protein